jgi:hypothetical protein
MVTIIIPISRKEYINDLFLRLELLKCDKDRVNLLTYVDGSLDLFQKVRNLTMNSKFKDRLCVYRKKGLPSVSSISRRRRRIAEIHNEVKEYLRDSKYVFLVEDDTVLPINALEKLYKLYLLKPYAGFVSGIQLGRWGFTYIGAWKVDDVYKPNRIESIKLSNGIKEVDCAGLYCCLIKTENYLNNEFKSFENILGPDTDLGLNLRKQGLKNYVDMSVRCGHKTKKEEINFLNSDIIKVVFERNSDYKFGWEQKIIKDVR